METLFIGIYEFFKKHRIVFIGCFAVSFLLVGFFASRLQFEEDISKVIPRDKTIDKLNQVFQNSKFLDKLVVTVSIKDSSKTNPDSLVAYAGSLVERLQPLSPLISKINDRVDDGLALGLFSSISEHLPVYLDEKDYHSIDSLIQPSTVKGALESNLRTLTSPSGFALIRMIGNDPVGISFIAFRKLQQLQYDENFELYDGYVVTKDQQHLMLFITPAFPPNNTGKNVKLLEGIDAVMDSLKRQGYGNIEASYFGATAVSVGNALQLRKDSMYTQGFTILFLVVFIGFFFRKKRAPVIILVPVIFGALFSLALIYFIRGKISVIALGTGSVVLGIAVSYSLHVFNHYRHTGDIRTVIRDLAMPLTIGGFTSIGGFLCLEFVESEMLKDLGLFAAFSLVGASLCSLIFLPHLVAGSEEKAVEPSAKLSWIDSIASMSPERNKLVVGIICALTIFFAFTARNVSFETDLLKMNYMPEKLRESERKLNALNQFSLQSVYLVSEGKTLNEALSNNEQMVNEIEILKERGIIKKYSGVSSLVVSDSLQAGRIKKWNSYWTNEKKQSLLKLLENEGRSLKFSHNAFDNFSKLLSKDFEPLDTATLNTIRKNFLNDFITVRPGQAMVVTLVKAPAEKKPAVYKAFENRPSVTVIDKQYLAGRFVQIINADFTSIALMSSILVFTVLLLTYGRIELTLVSFIPMLIAWVWILGIMGIFDIHFNIINIIISALIFGLGDDYSLFIMDGLLQEYKTGKKNLSAYKSSIFLSAITTVAGLGVLIFAKHPALRSIALISIIGILCVLLISQVLIPFLFSLLIKNRTDQKRFPWTFSGLLKSAFAFSYFVFGSILLTVFGFFLTRLRIFGKEKGKLVYHLVLSKFARSMIYIMANVKKDIINPAGENFSTPAVIICNHQSFLDILATVMLHPKLVLLTNDWVWNSPVFGAVVRMAEYYPVFQGAASSIDMLADKVAAGYSIVVFPEGTRSPDGNIKRFHKGAFYLAEKLRLDILPILIHGTGYTMSKGDFLLKDGRITLQFLPRIKPSDTAFGQGYAERVKQISRYFKDSYRELRREKETPSYFSERLIYNYLYKGPVLEWYMRVKIRLEKYYASFHELLPTSGSILDIGCGYGFMAYMLHFTSPQRNITGIDYDEMKIATANRCFDKNENINFFCTDVLTFEFKNYHAIILADMLHYLQPSEQRQVIERSIDSLLPGGTLLIRDGNSDLEKRHRGTKLTEFFSTRFVGFNKTSGQGLAFLSGRLIQDIACEKNVHCSVKDDSKFTSNVLFVLKKN